MARLFADEDFPFWIVEELRRLSHDVVMSRDVGLANLGTDDRAIFQAATADGRAVLTRNRRHFMRLHMRSPNHVGIIVCTADDNLERQAQRIHHAIAELDSLAGRLIRVNRPGPAEEQT